LIADETSFEMVDDPATDVRSTECASIGSSRKGFGDYGRTEMARQSVNRDFPQGYGITCLAHVSPSNLLLLESAQRFQRRRFGAGVRLRV
jgi:hypothetical protein